MSHKNILFSFENNLNLNLITNDCVALESLQRILTYIPYKLLMFIQHLLLLELLFPHFMEVIIIAWWE